MEPNTKLFESARVEKLVSLFLLLAALLVGIQTIGAFFSLFEAKPITGNVITVEGEGRVTAIPDVATVSFSVFEEAVTAEAAQEEAAQKVNTALALLRERGIEEKDIKTTSFNVSPKYSRPQPCFGGVCPEFDQRIIGYTTNQTISVTVRDTEMVGGVLSELGSAGVSNLSGPNFTIDDPDALQEEAREMAIEEAREKARTLAKDLGVRLVRVTGFWENTNQPFPRAFTESFGFGGDTASAAVPEIPTGENEIVSRVSITYEIR